MKGYKTLRDAIKMYPLAIPKMGERFYKIANTYLPYSIGIEVEAEVKYSYEEDYFREVLTKALNKMGSSDTHEQRYRFYYGTKGMIEAYNVCQLMKQHCEATDSGIHYHVDLSDLGSTTKYWEFFENNRSVDNDYKLDDRYNFIVKFMLNSLNSWDYKGDYNFKRFSLSAGDNTWIRYQTNFKTLEFRIGEMTFDYELLIQK